MSTVRTQRFHLQREAENPSRGSLKSVKSEGQKTARKALTDLSNASITSKASELEIKGAIKPHQKQVATSKRKKKSRLNASKDIDFNAEKEYMPKSDNVTSLAFETEFVPSTYFKDLISALKSTQYPVLPGLDFSEKETEVPFLPSLTLDTETRPDDSNYEHTNEEFAELPPLDLPPIDIPDFPDFQ